MTPPDEFELVITLPGQPTPMRVPLRRALTTMGSADSADARIHATPPHWLVAQRRESDVELCVLATGERFALQLNQSVALAGCQVLLSNVGSGEGAPLPVAQIADALAAVNSADEALRLLLSRVMAVTEANSGAIIQSERGSYHVAIALDSTGRALPGGERLLSDTIVREALAGGGVISAFDLAADERYRTIPSVVDLELSSVLAVPMALGDRILGAIYLGRRGIARPFDRAHARDLSVVASMSIPFLAQLRKPAPQTADSGLVGQSRVMDDVRQLIDRVAPTDLTVLIGGETGTGKEVVARSIHARSRRATKPMIALNCSAITPALLEAELFGYRKGAFTGAVTDRAGRIEAAHGSTLFLDEVGDMPMPMQAALLRVLQEREIVRIGENQPRAVDFRLLAASHRDLEQAAAEGRFRADLLYRLREMPMLLPPLRERGDDILLLANLFLRQAERELGIASRRLTTAASDALLEHGWPGNVRELRATLRRAAVLASGERISPAELGLSKPPGVTFAPRASPSTASPDFPETLGPLGRPLSEARDDFVRKYIAAVIHAHDDNREAAAAALGISLRSLYRHQ